MSPSTLDVYLVRADERPTSSVSSLPQATPDNILRQALTFHFSRFGSVLSVKIKREKDVRTVAPRKKEGDVWGWVWYEVSLHLAFVDEAETDNGASLCTPAVSRGGHERA